MNHISASQAPYTVCNSSLSEYGVLGNLLKCSAPVNRHCTLIYVDVFLPAVWCRF